MTLKFLHPLYFMKFDADNNGVTGRIFLTWLTDYLLRLLQCEA